MGKIGEEVITGVDRLMALLDKKNSVSVVEAAKELAVPRVVIEEWVDFLEENGIIEVEYKFTTPYITKKELTKPELEKKTKEFVGKREGFVRKVETAYKSIDLGTEAISRLKDEFELVSREIQKGSESIKNELAAMEKYEQLRSSMDKGILEAQNSFKKEMAAIDREILAKKQEYQQLAKHIEEKELEIDREIEKARLMPKNESILKERMRKIEEEAKKLETGLNSGRKAAEHEQSLVRLKEIAKKIEQGIEFRQNALVPLLEKRKQHEQKIIEMQKSLIDKLLAAKKKSGQSETRNLKERLQQFFSRKKHMDESLAKIGSDIGQLKAELKGLYMEAQAIRLTSKSKNRDFIAELEKKFQKTELKKKAFEAEVGRIGALLKSRA